MATAETTETARYVRLFNVTGYVAGRVAYKVQAVGADHVEAGNTARRFLEEAHGSLAGATWKVERARTLAEPYGWIVAPADQLRARS